MNPIMSEEIIWYAATTLLLILTICSMIYIWTVPLI